MSGHGGHVVDDNTRTEIVRMYQAGDKLSDIETDTGVSRGGIYLVLREAEIPLRRSPTRPAEWQYEVIDGRIQMPVDELTRQVQAAFNEVGRLQERVRVLGQLAIGLAGQIEGDHIEDTIAFVHSLMEQD